MEPVREQILNLQHISYTYHTLQGETLALSDISFSLKKGEFAAIVGPSGCGKSTLLSLICGLLPCTEGQIKINGKPLKESTTNVGYMLQHDELFEWRTIYNNVILGLEVQHALTARTKQRAHELLDIYGLGDFKNARPSELSGGMRQRAALIRTLVLEPELLLLDEPFSALDYQTRLQVGDDIGQIIRNEGKSALLVTHDLSEAISLADRVIVLSNRPATIKQTIPLLFHLEHDTPLNRRSAPEFKNYFNLIWKELNEDEPNVKDRRLIFYSAKNLFIKVPAAQKVRSCCPGSPSGCLPVCLGTDRLTSNHRFFYL